MKNSQRELAMNLLVTMMIQDRAARLGKSFTECFSEFRRSKTMEKLYDPSTGLWMNGPDYLSDEYDIDLKRERDRALLQDVDGGLKEGEADD